MDDGCGDNPFSPCHRICRYKCCQVDYEDSRSCYSSEEKLCRELCFGEKNCNGNGACMRECRRECCHDDGRLQGSIMIPERRRNIIFMFSGEKPSGSLKVWDEAEALWSMRLHPHNLWIGSNSINDVKRVVHKGRVHVVVCGNGGDSKCILVVHAAVVFCSFKSSLIHVSFALILC